MKVAPGTWPAAYSSIVRTSITVSPRRTAAATSWAVVVVIMLLLLGGGG
jgi:preprotein translocase subunit SecF